MPPPWTAAPGPIGGAPFNYNAYEDPNSAQCTMRRGIMTAMVGFAILIGLSFIGYRGGDGPFSPASIHPGPWLFGGLIPMFVGIAQIIIALMSGATFNIRMMPPPIGPTAAPPPPGQRSYGSAPARAAGTALRRTGATGAAARSHLESNAEERSEPPKRLAPFDIPGFRYAASGR